MDKGKIYSLIAQVEPTSDHSVTVYDRPVKAPGAKVIGTVNSGPHGIEAHAPHYSLAERAGAKVGGRFQVIAEGVIALIAAMTEPSDDEDSAWCQLHGHTGLLAGCEFCEVAALPAALEQS